jgi:uncharacterized protein (UPF0276 family)
VRPGSGPPALGVGLTFHPPLEAFIEQHSALIDVLELEPQTLWLPAAAAGQSFGTASGAMDRLAALEQRTLVHSVGTPVGGTRLGDRRQLPLLREAIARLDAPWCSEHLSFNVAGGAGGPFFTSFMLPPRQTAEGVQCAAASARELAELLGAPLAIETGVSYLRPRRDELRDGEFVAAVAEAAGCGILLDIHNIWTNELNGRQPILSYLDDLPLDRVWELHLAGGEEHAGFWLDAHSGAIPDEVLRVAGDVLSATPNVGAIIFELMPEQVASLGDDGLRRQLEAMRLLWDGRPSAAHCSVPAASRAPEIRTATDGHDDVQAWEDALGALAIGLHPDSDLAAELADDPGVGIVRTMVEAARAGSLVTSLRLSMRLLLMHEGEQGTREIMQAFWDTAPPQPFAGDEGLAFAAWLPSASLELPFLDDVLAFELALLRASISGETTTVRFGADPAVLLGALAEGRLPEAVTAGDYAFEVSPQAVR